MLERNLMQSVEIIEKSTLSECSVASQKSTVQSRDKMVFQESQICHICSSRSGLKSLKEDASLMMLLRNILHINEEHDINHSDTTYLCSSCVGKLKGVSSFISSSLSNEENLKSVVGENAINSYSSRTNEDNTFANSNYNMAIVNTEIIYIKEPPIDNEVAATSKINSGPKFECELCKKSFGRKFDLKRHSYTHQEEKPFKCDHCEKRFSDRSYLKKHLPSHAEESLFQCDYCKSSFTDEYLLQRHLFSSAKGQIFKCNFCEMNFDKKCSWNYHLVSHTEESQLKCYQCEKSFSRKYFLKRHLLSHTGERPFDCDHCQRSFSQKAHLQRHMLTHTGDRPFKCDTCGKKFTQKGYLKRHLDAHLRKKSSMCRRKVFSVQKKSLQFSEEKPSEQLS